MTVPSRSPRRASRRSLPTVLLAVLLSWVVVASPPSQAQEADRDAATDVAGALVQVASSDAVPQGESLPVDGRLVGEAATAGTRVAVTLAAPDGTVLSGPTEVVTSADGSWDVAFPAAATADVDLDAANDYGVVLAARAEVLDGPAAGEVAAAQVPLQAPPQALLLEANFTSSVGWVKPGQAYPFQVTLRNLTATDATNAVVTIPPVAGTTWTGGTPIGGTGTVTVATDGTLTWDVGTVAGGSVDEPTIVTLVVDAQADELTPDSRLVWSNISADAHLEADGVTADSVTHGPKVIPPNGVYETARYGDRPFPVVPVDYYDRKHLDSNSGDELETVINDPSYTGSTFNLFQEMSYGQLFPNGTVPSADIATADWSAFDTSSLHTPRSPLGDQCRTLGDNDTGGGGDPGTVPEYHADEIGTATLPERVVNGFYQLPGDNAYYGADNGDFPDGDIDSGCGTIGKVVFDAAALADPEIDYNDYDTDKDGVVDFFMMVFAGCGGNGPSQRGCDDPAYDSFDYDNIWPHSSTLEGQFTDPDTGQVGYVSDDRLTDLEGELLFYTDATYTALTTTETDYPAFVRVGPYNVNPEDSLEAASVISHEYGHSLGLPDYYATTGGVEYYGTWNLMASDYSQHMDLNGRQELGWVIPQEIPADAEDFEVDLVESTTDTNRIDWRTPEGDPYSLTGPDVHNGDAWMAPLKKRVLLDPGLVDNGASPTHVFWSDAGDDFGCPPSPAGHSLDVALDVLADVAPGSDVELSFNSYWDIEWDYDYGFVLATTDTGQTYTSLPNEQGYTLPADDNPNNVQCQDRYGNGLTGTSGSWEDGDATEDRDDGAQTPGTAFLPLTYDLSAFAGQATDLRFAYNTDVGLTRPGWYIDDVTVTVDGEDVIYTNDFEGAPDEGVVNGGCTDDGGILTGPCSDEWIYLEAGARSSADHGYYVELRDRTGFDFDGHGEADRGPITWEPGVSLGYTDEAGGYGNTGTFARPNQTILDANPTPLGTGESILDTVDPDLDDAAWKPSSTPFSDFGEGWADNYLEVAENGDFIPWVLDFQCLEMDVTSMSGDGVGPEIPPGDLEASVAFTRGVDCGFRDYGFGPPPDSAPTAVAQAVPSRTYEDEEVTLDGSMSADDYTPRADLGYSWDVDGDGTEDETGQVVTVTYPDPGTYEVTLTVTDEKGQTDTDTVEVEVVENVDQVVRVAGDDREATSVALSMQAFPDDVVGDVDTAVLARSDTFPDALAASSLAIAAGGPVLLTPKDELRDDVYAELERLDVDTVYLTGGPNALSTAVEDRAGELGVEVVRLSGPNRLETAVAIADEVRGITGSTDVMLARSDTFADALAASNLADATGAPLLLTKPSSLDDATAAALEGSGQVYIIGGPNAVSTDIEDELAADHDVTRLSGSTRYTTAIEVAWEAGVDVEPTVLASGQTFPDALSSGPAAAALGGRLLLADPRGTNTALLAVLETDEETLDTVFIAGGPGALPSTLDRRVLEAIRPDLTASGAASARKRLQRAVDGG